ncbi:MAG: hypothetical protein IKA82_00330 [Clostridia bacterium]|nr:hypothetical protein [Clostridia bacterium]
MSKKTPDFMMNASNVYRTEHFIVKQRVGVLYSTTDYNVLFSRDIYYARTAQRDAEYEAAFSAREDIEGRRLSVNTYIREYKS